MQKYFFIRTDGRFIKINYEAILFIEGAKNYTKIITETKSYLALITMKKIEELLPPYLFKRIHKSFIVSLDKILEFDRERVWLKNKELPVGQQYRNELEKIFIIVNDKQENRINKKPQAAMQVLVHGKQTGSLAKVI